MTRYNDSEFSNKKSVTRQSQFDFDLLQDREYKYFCSTNDDGWLVGNFPLGETLSTFCGTILIRFQFIFFTEEVNFMIFFFTSEFFSCLIVFHNVSYNSIDNLAVVYQITIGL